MTEILDRPVDCAANWKGPEIARSTDWIYTLTDADVAELEAALYSVKAKGLTIPDITRADFPLPGLSAKLADILEEMEGGRDFVLMRGVRTAAWCAAARSIAARTRADSGVARYANLVTNASNVGFLPIPSALPLGTDAPGIIVDYRY